MSDQPDLAVFINGRSNNGLILLREQTRVRDYLFRITIQIKIETNSVNRQLKQALKRIPPIRWLASKARREIERIRPKVEILQGKAFYQTKSYSDQLNIALADAHPASDISDHLPTIYFACCLAQPNLIVELGTRGGESTRALLAAAALNNAKMLSIDVDPCGTLQGPYVEHWTFIQADDVTFGKESFRPWCSENGLTPEICVLFIDTSHEFHHTCQELATWLPFVKSGGFILLHDTNMRRGAYWRRDGSKGRGWDNGRGVIKALEQHLGRDYDENSFFCDTHEAYSLLHFPNCNGLTILSKR